MKKTAYNLLYNFFHLLTQMNQSATQIAYTLVSIANLLFIYTYANENFSRFLFTYVMHFISIYMISSLLENNSKKDRNLKYVFMAITAFLIGCDLGENWRLTLLLVLSMFVFSYLVYEATWSVISVSYSSKVRKFLRKYPELAVSLMWIVPIMWLAVSIITTPFVWYVKLLLFVISILLTFPVWKAADDGMSLENIFTM